MRRRRPNNDTVEIQMGPMIDIVFLLLVFFLVTAKPIKPESDVGIRLPGTVPQEEILDLPDEQRVVIQQNGQVVLNDMQLDGPNDKKLPNLLKILKRLKEASEANKSQPMVTIDAHDESDHQRIMDVLNVCATAEIVGVTLATVSQEEDF
ncbi:MAG: biopolymer transporter ExbD [Verrucomicrobiota bacterium]